MKIQNVVIAGGGVLGSQIAYQCSYAGVHVTTYLRSEASVERARPKVARHHGIYTAELQAAKTGATPVSRGLVMNQDPVGADFDKLLQKADAAYEGFHYETDLAAAVADADLVIEALAARVTNGALRYDDGGKLARQGQVSAELLRYLVDSDDYLRLAPPKTTGREHYSAAFVDALWRKGEELGLTGYDKIATATAFTAESICLAVEHHCPQRPERLIVGGGGSHNPVLMELLQAGLPGCEVVTNEALGLDSDAKEAVAFAILANEMLHGRCNNAPSATGAAHPVVMGKLSL